MTDETRRDVEHDSREQVHDGRNSNSNSNSNITKSLDPNRRHRVGDYAVIQFGAGTQLVHVVGETARRLEIVRCANWQQHGGNPCSWNSHTSKVSRDDVRLHDPRPKPAYLPCAPTREEIAEAKARLAYDDAHRCALWENSAWNRRRGVGLTVGMVEDDRDEAYQAHARRELCAADPDSQWDGARRRLFICAITDPGGCAYRVPQEERDKLVG